MKAFFDTSVLVPVFYRPHTHHQESMKLFLQADKQTACCGVHSLAELYSTVTRMPGRIIFCVAAQRGTRRWYL